MEGDYLHRPDSPQGVTTWENGTWTVEVLQPIALTSNPIAINADVNQRYVSDVGGGASWLIANQTQVGPLEKFQVVDLGHGNVAIKSVFDGRYVTAEDAGASPLIANRTTVTPWETFRWVTLGNNSFALRAQANGLYVSAPAGGGSSLQAVASVVSAAEMFHWSPKPDSCAANSLLSIAGSCVTPSASIYGYWPSSGGQDPNSPNNRVILADVAAAGTVTFDLSSATADTYLYLLNGNNQVLASSNTAGVNGVDRITMSLAAGTYKLVAATNAVGQTAQFTLLSDKAKLRYPQQLDVIEANEFDFVYDDIGTGANSGDIGVWRPRLSQYPGYYSLGDVGMPSDDRVPSTTFLVRGAGDLLKPPVDYTWVWDDVGTGGSHDATFWAPVAPAGYTCLGNVVWPGYGSKPPVDLIRCVKTDYVLPANPAWLWTDKGSGGDSDVTVYQPVPQDHRGLGASTFVGQGWYGARAAPTGP